MIRSHARRAIIALAGAAIVATATVGAAMPPDARPAQLCIPILLPCPASSPTPSPSPTAPSLPGVPSLPGATPGAPGTSGGTPSTPAPEPTASPTPTADGTAPVFTQPPAQLGSQGLSFTGLKGIALVTVQTVSGPIRALRISADSITITGFSLTVRKATGPVLLTTADTMTLRGDVQVYLDSLTANTSDGKAYTLGASTPPPAPEAIAGGLLHVTLGLVGATADSIRYTNTDQRFTP